jgi:hypothetical protein
MPINVMELGSGTNVSMSDWIPFAPVVTWNWSFAIYRINTDLRNGC